MSDITFDEIQTRIDKGDIKELVNAVMQLPLPPAPNFVTDMMKTNEIYDGNLGRMKKVKNIRLIDANALLKELENPIVMDADKAERIWEGWHECTIRVDDIIKKAPTIEERKTGRWEERQVTDDKCVEEWQSARCSVCGKYHTTPYLYYFDSYNYCPNCGAHMIEDGYR